jgi:hypothetical protein
MNVTDRLKFGETSTNRGYIGMSQRIAEEGAKEAAEETLKAREPIFSSRSVTLVRGL